MQQIRTYILSIGTSGLLCALCTRMTGNESIGAKALKLVTGLVMLLTLLQPLGRIRLEDLTDYFDSYQLEGASAVELGENRSTVALRNSIKEGLASYILDKGATHGANLTVRVILDESMPPRLCSVELNGDISPYSRQALVNALCQDLGLEEEDILWQ